jgi:hypothetical protein
MIPRDSASSVASGYNLRVSVGGGKLHDVEIDTGSIGVVVPLSAVGKDAHDTGTAGQMEYTSDGKIFSGEYYMAPLRIVDASGHSVKTTSIRVLAVSKSSCDTSGHPDCRAGGVKGLGMMGVGFARGTGTSAINPFLHTLDSAGKPMRAAYIIRNNAIILGADASDETSFESIALTRSSSGDWNGLAGCFSISSATYCGSILMDTGIKSMILSVSKAKRPKDMRDKIAAGTAIDVWAPAGTKTFSVHAVVGAKADAAATKHAIGPSSARWSDGKGTTYFINTGRTVLEMYDYLYDSVTGKVGFYKRS